MEILKKNKKLNVKWNNCSTILSIFENVTFIQFVFLFMSLLRCSCFFTLSLLIHSFISWFFPITCKLSTPPFRFIGSATSLWTLMSECLLFGRSGWLVGWLVGRSVIISQKGQKVTSMLLLEHLFLIKNRDAYAALLNRSMKSKSLKSFLNWGGANVFKHATLFQL